MMLHVSNDVRRGGAGEREGKMLWGTCHSETQGFLSFLSESSCTVSPAARLGAPVLDVPTTSVGWPTFAI